ncbi:MAG TPA: hypothetical protein VF158_17145 [Longimicrobiales bacterium]
MTIGIGLGIFRPLYYSPDLLFRWRAGWAGGSFSRSSSAWYVGPDGRIYQTAANAPRVEWYDLDGDGVRETPTALLEPAATNLLLDSCNLPASGSAWGGESNFSVSPATSIFAGQTAWRHQNLGLAGSVSRNQNIGTFTGQPETGSAIVENVDATETALNIRDNTAMVNLCIGRLTWATGQASVQGGAGTVLALKLANAGPNGGPVYRLIVTATGTPGNSGSIFLYPSGTSQNTRTVIVHHVQHEVGAVATSPIVTTTAAVTRSADALSFPLPASLSRPVPMTLYLRFVERGAAFEQAFQGDIVEIGSTARPLLQVDNANDTGTYRVLYTTAVGVDSFSDAPVAVAVGDVVELAAVLTAAGAARIRIARNGGAEQAGPDGTARGLGAAPWPVQTLGLAVRNQSPLDVIELKVATGEHTIADIRSM